MNNNKKLIIYIKHLFEILNSNNFTVQTIYNSLYLFNNKNFKLTEIKLIINNKIIIKFSPFGYHIYDTYNKYNVNDYDLDNIKIKIYDNIHRSDAIQIILTKNKYNLNKIIINDDLIINKSLLEYINE